MNRVDRFLNRAQTGALFLVLLSLAWWGYGVVWFLAWVAAPLDIGPAVGVLIIAAYVDRLAPLR